MVSPGTAAVVYEQSSGLAPATVTFTMDPGRSGVVRQHGTNMWTGAGTEQGTAINVTLSSPEAINIPPTIRVYMNYRQPSQRGMIYPVPTGPNGDGLQDIVYDASRSLVYITNSAYNRIEVFDAVQNQFDNPIPVGQLPHQMAMSTDGNTLYVANTGGESISIVDLNLGKVVDNVQFPPIPRQGNAAVITPHTIAMGLFGLQFLMSDGSQWEVVNGDQATVRPADSVTPVKFAGTPNIAMLASPGQHVHHHHERQRPGVPLRRHPGRLRHFPPTDHQQHGRRGHHHPGLLRRSGRGGRRVRFSWWMA